MFATAPLLRDDEQLDEQLDDQRERTIPHLRRVGPGHPSARSRAPRIERRAEGTATVAQRVLAEAGLIDQAFGAAQPQWASYDPYVLDLLMNRR